MADHSRLYKPRHCMKHHLDAEARFQLSIFDFIFTREQFSCRCNGFLLPLISILAHNL